MRPSSSREGDTALLAEYSRPLCPSVDAEEVDTIEVHTGARTLDAGVDLATFFGLFSSL